MRIEDEAEDLLEAQPELVQEAIDRMRLEYEGLVARGAKDSEASRAVWEEVVPSYPALARALLLASERSGAELVPALDSEAIMAMIGRYEVGESSYDINALAGALIAVGERHQAGHGDLGAVAAAYGLDAGDLLVVMDHQERQLAACSAPAAMVAGILIGVALARGETPPNGTPLPDWVRKLG